MVLDLVARSLPDARVFAENTGGTSSRQVKRAGRIENHDRESTDRCTFDYSRHVHKAKNRRKTGSPRDLLYMQIKDGYGGNRGM